MSTVKSKDVASGRLVVCGVILTMATLLKSETRVISTLVQGTPTEVTGETLERPVPPRLLVLED